MPTIARDALDSEPCQSAKRWTRMLNVAQAVGTLKVGRDARMLYNVKDARMVKIIHDAGIVGSVRDAGMLSRIRDARMLSRIRDHQDKSQGKGCRYAEQ